MKYSKIKFCIVVLTLLTSRLLHAQKEGNIWYFGVNAGLDFNSGAPHALTNGVLSTLEGSSSIADVNGNLLFYTDGITVYNNNHLQMPNGSGLLGHWSSTQSALIVPQPESSNIYYIFTTYFQGGFGFYYSIVDMSLQGGLGDVTTKNIALFNPVTEKQTAVRHENGCDLWVITHEYRTLNFRAYLVNDAWIDTTPVISSVGSVHTPDLQNLVLLDS